MRQPRCTLPVVRVGKKRLPRQLQTPHLLFLASCFAASAATTVLPAGWPEAIASGSMLAYDPAASTAPLDPRLRPNIGNGYLATLAGAANVYLAGVYNIVGTTEPFRARLPGVAAMVLELHRGGNGTVRKTCAVQPPEQRVRCGTPPYTPAQGCTAAQGCCYGAFAPDPSSQPITHDESNWLANNNWIRDVFCYRIPAPLVLWCSGVSSQNTSRIQSQHEEV